MTEARMSPERERLEVPTLEELLERGEVKSALLLNGDFTERERDLIRQAWEAGLASAADQLEQAEQRLVLIHRNATSWHATEAGKDRALAVIADWASGEEIPQVLLDDLAAQSKESEDSRA